MSGSRFGSISVLLELPLLTSSSEILGSHAPGKSSRHKEKGMLVVMRSLLLIGLLIMMSLCQANVAHAVQYQITSLGAFEGVQSATAVAINDNGQVIGGFNGGGSFLWQDGHFQNLGSITVYDVNNKGQIAGSSQNQPLIWQNSNIQYCTDYPTYRVISSERINDLGQVSIYSQYGYSYSWVWSSDGLTPIQGYSNAVVGGINNQGQVVVFGSGFEYVLPGGSKIWQNGSWGDSVGEQSQNEWRRYGINAVDINDNGVVAGAHYFAERKSYNGTWRYDDFQPCIWQNWTRTDIPLLPGYKYGCATRINSQGSVIGYVKNDMQTIDASYFFWEDGTTYSIADMLPSESGWTITNLTDINNTGQIVGYGTYNGQQSAFIMTPVVPEPSSLVALFCGFGGLAGAMRRRLR